ncbi:MAG: glycerophosphodiester phosphodiesterase [Chloroflexota bacterium]
MMRRIPKEPFADERGVIVMAHRGGSKRWPENTMLAFQNAADLGVDGLELDIRSTADGGLVVIHDETVDRVTNGRGPVHDFTLAELQQLDAGYHWTNDGGQSYPFRGQGVTIPTLAEVFAAFPHLWINIDIKQSDPTIVEPFVALLHEMGMVGQECVGSFAEETVQQFRQACPDAATAASLPEAQRLFVLSRLVLGALYRGGATAMQLPEVEGRLRIVTPGFVRAAHRRGWLFMCGRSMM